MSKSMLFLYVETPLHAGAGRGLGTVDLPIQRERATGYPMIQASGIKGRLRAQMKSNQMPNEELLAVFGPETENASEYAGAISFGDARLLLFPVRSLAGVFAWVTSLDVLARFHREAGLIGQAPDWGLPHSNPNADQAWVGSDALKAGGRVVLEEFSFTAVEKAEVVPIGNWLAQYAFPGLPEYEYWKKSLPQKLCILPDDAFRDFVMFGTEVQTHISLDYDTKTVKDGALWTSESLPVDSVVYTPLLANSTRHTTIKWDAAATLKKLTGANLLRVNFGGDETTGQGFVALKFWGGVE